MARISAPFICKARIKNYINQQMKVQNQKHTHGIVANDSGYRWSRLHRIPYYTCTT
jgi:hypothetical protein